MNDKQKQRILRLVIGILIAIIALYLAIDTLRDEASLFQSPKEALQLPAEERAKKSIRLGGLVLEGSLETNEKDGSVRFIVTDFQDDIQVTYKGLLPDLFREGQGVYIDGQFDASGKIFIAETVLAKHDETYTPPLPGDVPEDFGFGFE